MGTGFLKRFGGNKLGLQNGNEGGFPEDPILMEHTLKLRQMREAQTAEMTVVSVSGRRELALI